jgi:hypothetical protein
MGDMWHLFPIEQGCLYISQKMYILGLYRIKYVLANAINTKRGWNKGSRTGF